MEMGSTLSGELTLSTVHMIIVAGAVIGSIKATFIAQSKDKINVSRLVFDVVLGTFCGCMVGFYYLNNNNIFITGLIALLAGASGSIVVSVAIEVLPMTLKDFIIDWLEKHFK